MKKSRSVVGIAVAVSTLVLVVAGAIAYRATDALASTSEAVLRAKELELSLERLLSTLRDAETGQRGYLLSGSEEYLAPYDRRRALAAGFDTHLVKPVDFADVSALCRRIVATRAQPGVPA